MHCMNCHTEMRIAERSADGFLTMLRCTLCGFGICIDEVLDTVQRML